MHEKGCSGLLRHVLYVNSIFLSIERHQLLYSKGTSKIGVERDAIVGYVDNAYFMPCNL